MRRRERLLAGFIVASALLVVASLVMPEVWVSAALALMCAYAFGCLWYGRRRVRLDGRLPWTLLLVALAAEVASYAVQSAGSHTARVVGFLADAAANVVLLAAALALIARRGARDLGGLLDAAVIAAAAGSVMWALLPHRLGTDRSWSAQIDLFVVVFALTGVTGALVRLARTATEPVPAVRWLLTAIAFGIAGNVTLSIGGSRDIAERLAGTAFLAAFAALALFGLDHTAPRLAYPQAVTSKERLSSGRLVLLWTAIAASPILAGTRNLTDASIGGLMIALQGVLVAALVLARIGALARQRAAAEDALAFQAAHDPLTGLLNRRVFVEELRHQLARGTGRVAVAYCDLDEFKAVNDNLGHDAGDRLLVAVADRLAVCVGPAGMVSRFGGDEFVVLLADSTPAEAHRVRDSISAALSQPFPQAYGIRAGTSVGLTFAAPGDRDPEHVLRLADEAMYGVKQDRRARPDGAR